MSISLEMIILIFKIYLALLPFAFFPYSSEIFEFSKLLLTYTTASIIFFFWGLEIVKQKKFVFRRTPMDVPILLFLGTQFLSTLLSIDQRTSFLGYYSRWNGGLLSLICYSFLYWAFVTHVNKDQLFKIIKIILYSSFVASFLGFLEHFGYSFTCLLITRRISVDCWVQDVQNRVFGTFGQPNWMAAWLLGIIPFSIYFASISKKLKNKFVYSFLFTAFLITLYFTKSRSGFVGLIIELVIVFFGLLYSKKLDLKILFYSVCIVILTTVTISTPWKINLFEKESKQNTVLIAGDLESGGTESGDIRKIVWKGAFELFKKYPIFGSGVETFAHAYYQTRPKEHNLTSEWNFIYNKAHNEYLNYLATTGVLGLASYLFLLISIFIIGLKANNKSFSFVLIASLASILVSNFFGFSTVPVNILIFLTPALIIVSNNSHKSEFTININKNFILISISIVTFYFLYMIVMFFVADLYYQKSIKETDLESIKVASSLFPNEPIFSLKKAELLMTVQPNESLKILSDVDSEILFNTKLLKQQANLYSELGQVDSSFNIKAIEILDNLSTLAPTDPTIFFSRAIAKARIGKIDQSLDDLKIAIDLKDNYKQARRLFAYINEDLGNKEIAKEQYEYILNKIDPNDQTIKDDLEDLAK